MAVEGIERLRVAADLLHCWDNDVRTLIAAASEVWSAMRHLPSWPQTLRMKAVELQALLFRHGSLRLTIRLNSDEYNHRLAQELLAFCQIAEEFEETAALNARVPDHR